MNILGEVRKVIPVNSGGVPLDTSGVPITALQYTGSTNTIVTSNGTAIVVPVGKKALVQNLDDAAVYVRYGATASASNFTFLLKAGTAVNDGNGGSYMVDDFAGTLTFFAATGDPRVNVAVFN